MFSRYNVFYVHFLSVVQWWLMGCVFGFAVVWLGIKSRVHNIQMIDQCHNSSPLRPKFQAKDLVAMVLQQDKFNYSCSLHVPR